MACFRVRGKSKPDIVEHLEHFTQEVCDVLALISRQDSVLTGASLKHEPHLVELPGIACCVEKMLHENHVGL